MLASDPAPHRGVDQQGRNALTVTPESASAVCSSTTRERATRATPAPAAAGRRAMGRLTSRPGLVTSAVPPCRDSVMPNGSEPDRRSYPRLLEDLRMSAARDPLDRRLLGRSHRVGKIVTVRSTVFAPDGHSLPVGAKLDPVSAEWLRSLAGVGSQKEAAVARLHESLLKISRAEVASRRARKSA